MNAGRHALVTGGIRGIGLDIGRALLRTKLEKLCITDINEHNANLDELYHQYPGKAIIFLKCDVTQKDQVDRCYKEALKQFNHIDIVVNNAGIFDDLNCYQTLLTNQIGVINSSLLGLQYMSLENGGHGGYIINVASTAGLGPSFFAPIYSSAKWGVVGFTRSMGYHYYYENLTGVKFMAICPGITMTNIYDHLTDRLLMKEFKQIVKEQLIKKATFQNIATTGNCVLEALKADKNGAIFICDCNVIKEVQLTEFTKEFVTKNLDNY